MYLVNDNYINQISREENEPVDLLIVNTGYYWDGLDNMDTDNWTRISGDYWNITHASSVTHSTGSTYGIQIGALHTTNGKAWIEKTVIVTEAIHGLRFWYYVDWSTNQFTFGDRENGIYTAVYIKMYINGVVVLETDVALFRNEWRVLEYFEEMSFGQYDIRIELTTFSGLTSPYPTGIGTPPWIWFDDLEKFNLDNPLYIANSDQDMPWYIPGTEDKVLYSAFPFTISETKAALTGEVEGCKVSMGGASRYIITLLLDNNALRGKEVKVISTFWGCRVGGVEEDPNCFQIETFEIDSANADEESGNVQFILKSKMNINKIYLPLEPFNRDRCRHTYKDPNACKYSGPIYSCDRSKGGTNGCSVHDNIINFGGFPGIPMGRIVVM